MPMDASFRSAASRSPGNHCGRAAQSSSHRDRCCAACSPFGVPSPTCQRRREVELAPSFSASSATYLSSLRSALQNGRWPISISSVESPLSGLLESLSCSSRTLVTWSFTSLRSALTSCLGPSGMARERRQVQRTSQSRLRSHASSIEAS